MGGTISLQLQGIKQWRFSMMPRRSTPSKLGDFSRHGAVYEDGGWDPEYVVNVTAGEILFIPPGAVHETQSVGGEWSASVSYQISSPPPALLWSASTQDFGGSVISTSAGL